MVWKVLLVIAVILVIVLVALYYFGRKLEKRQAEGQAQLDAAAQTVSMLIIDKKKLRMKESGLPQMVIDQTPWYLRRSKMPIVKAKIGPKIMTLVADGAVYDLLPVKKEEREKATTAETIFEPAAASTSPPLRVPEADLKSHSRKKASSKDFSTNKTRTL